ncbi:hypothetical protein CTAYLR_003761 [Chrysophaeum taylorii]|uniref:HECT-type E3 ubiquitin transferase n=1 Tax=Chrysophaeum taylorii TaxID=2483200 RepID=A0AAD7UFG2_9STRA|nr:hypothetical protein CTAYLR_003761 [Chrysophaeum taylorii]
MVMLEYVVLVLIGASDARAPTLRPTTIPFDENSSDDEGQPSFVQGYVFVMVIALVLFCGCACLSANTVQFERGGASAGAAPQEEAPDRLVLLRDSLVESGESVWVCFVCAFENKPRSSICALCGATYELTKTFDDRIRKKAPGVSMEDPLLPLDLRAQSFVIGRLNELTLRQKGAARRHVWRRKRRRDGLAWEREAALQTSQSRESLAYVAKLEEADDDDDWRIRWSVVADVDDALATAAAAAAAPPAPPPRSMPPSRWRCWQRQQTGELARPLLEEELDLEAVAARPFKEKQVWFERQTKRGDKGRPVTIEVRRDHVVQDSMRRFEQVGSRLSRCPLRIRFRGEVAIDAGGVEREWFDVLARQLFSSQLGLFESRREAGYAANISPTAGDKSRLFRFAGRFVAKALREQIPLPVSLALPLLKHVLSVPLSFSDLEFVDAESFQSYAWIRDNDPNPLQLDFSLDAGVELVPGGSRVAVTRENKSEYLALVLKYRVLDSIKPQLIAFLRGIDDLLDRSLLTIFDYQELQLVVGGLSDIDVDDWKRHTRYLGAFAGGRHPVVHMFWRCVESFDNTERARLCQFATGASQLPPSGFKALVGEDGRYCAFTLASLPRSLGVWPRAHTCFNRLDLPIYASYEELHSYLSLSIHLEVVGFTME